jgi:hypothetical protein
LRSPVSDLPKLMLVAGQVKEYALIKIALQQCMNFRRIGSR